MSVPFRILALHAGILTPNDNMMDTKQKAESLRSHPGKSPSAIASWMLLLLVFAGIFLAALHTPPLLDDADATHAQAAAHMAETGDLVTLRVNGPSIP